MGRLARLVVVMLVAAGAPALARERGVNDLLRVVTPTHKAHAAAHPFVNVVVGFGTTDKGVPADPSTFRVRVGRVDATRLFSPTTDARGRVTGMRGRFGPAILRLGGWNRVKIEVRSVRTAKGRVFRDVDRLRFRADDVENQAPEVRLVSDDIVVIPGQTVEFDASQSTDPEGDDLTFTWDFGDGTTASGPAPSHVYGETSGDVTVRLTVSDGQADRDAETLLFGEPAICPTCTRGVLKVDAAQRLEFGAVPLGTTATRTLTVRNPDTTPTSQLAVVLGIETPGFSVAPSQLTLGPGESSDVTVTFAPTSEGHQGGTLAAVASASNQRFIEILAHGYGGNAPGNGPLPIAEPLFYNDIGTATRGIFPDGTRWDARTGISLCRLNGTTTFDYCITDADCAANGGTCPQGGAGRCLRGDRQGEACSTTGDCPGGICDTDIPFDPVDMCGDGRGGLYLMSEEGTFTDPNQNATTSLSSTLARAQFDASGQRTAFQILARVNEFSSQLACDGTSPENGGRVYWAQYQDLDFSGDCFRDSRESLLSVRKSGGGQTVILPRIDAIANVAECDDIEEVTDLEMTRDGSTVYASLSLGLWRARPSPLLMTPDVDDNFQVHPDGSVVVTTVTDQGASGIVRVYKISPDQAVHGAQLLRDLTPCATLTVPNNRPSGSTTGATRLASFAVGRSAPGSFDATILVSVFGTGGSPAVLVPELRLRALYAIASPAASDQCTVLGLVGLESLDQLTF